MKIIDIINGRGFFRDKTPQLLTAAELELSVILPNESGEYFIVAKANDKIFKKEIKSGLPFTLYGVSGEDISFTVNHYLCGELIDVYPCEKLLLSEVEDNIYAVPELVEVYRRIDGTEKRLSDLEEQNKLLTQAFVKLNERLKIFEKNYNGD